MRQELEVWLYGRRAGMLHRSGADYVFTYEPEYLEDEGATPLSLSMPLVAPSYRGKAVEAFLWGLFPDNQDVITRWARQFGVKRTDLLGLLTHVGREVAGAAQFLSPASVDEPAEVEPVDEEWIATRLRSLRDNTAAWTNGLDRGLFSLAGAQSKFALRFVEGQWGLPMGSAATTHILKPAIAGLPDHDVNELLCLDAASGAGVLAAEAKVMTFGDERALVVTRYDRLVRGEDVTRVHQEDLCQMLGVHPDQKYQGDGGPSIERIIAQLQAVDPLGHEELVPAFLDGVIVNWLLMGADAHAKNYSVLLAGPGHRFAPLYDLGSALGVPELDRNKVKSAMKIGNTYDLGYIGASQWRRLAERNRLDAQEVMARAAHLAQSLPDSLDKAAQSPDVTALGSAMPERLAKEVRLWCADRLARLD